jgi:TolB protein
MHRSRWIATSTAIAGLLALAPMAPAAPPRGTTPERMIAYIRDGDLWTVPSTGGEDVQITSGPGKDADPSWAPDGASIAFTRVTSQGPQVWIVDSAGGAARRLMNRAADPSWSPDGSSIAFVRRVKGNTDIWAAESDGSRARRLTSSPAPDLEPSWGPRKIAFVSGRGGRRSIWIMAPDGRGERRLTDGKGTDRAPTWVADAPGGTVLHEHIDTDGDHDLRTVDLVDGDLDKIHVREDDDRAPASASLPWFAFVRATPTTSTIRTSDLDAPITSMRIIVSMSTTGLADPAVAP